MSRYKEGEKKGGDQEEAEKEGEMAEGEIGGGEIEEGEGAMLSIDDFTIRGIPTDKEWTAFDALLKVAEVATEIYEIQKYKKKEKDKSLKKPMTDDSTDVCKQERLAREKTLKKPITDIFVLSNPERLAREKAVKKPIMCPDFAIMKRYVKFKEESEEEEEEEEDDDFKFKNKSKNKKTGLKRKYSDSEDDYEWGEEFKAKKSSHKIDKKTKSGSDKKKPKKSPKKKDVASCSQRSLPDMPQNMRDLITSIHGTNLQRVIQKPLSVTDMSGGHSRVSIPHNQIIEKFLTEEEVEFLDWQNDMTITTVVEPSLKISDNLILRQWDGKGNNFSYVLKRGWNDVKTRNGLKTGDIVQIWSFRIEGELCFAIFKVNEGVDSARSSQTSEDNNNGISYNGSENGACTEQSGVDVQGGSGCIGDGNGASSSSPSGEGEHGGHSSNASCNGSIGNGSGVGSNSHSPEGEHGGSSSNASGDGSDGSGDCVLTSQSRDMGSSMQSGIQED